VTNPILALSPPGNSYPSITLFIVATQEAKYPVSIAGLLTSSTKIYVGGMGGRFMYSLEAIKSTEPFLNSERDSLSYLRPTFVNGE